MYLVVKFFDNDFGTPMLEALNRLWGYINDNTAVYASKPGRLTVPEIYDKLHRCGALQPMLLRLFILENLCRGVEQRTRGLCLDDLNWYTRRDNNPSHLEPDTYLRCEVALYGQFEVIPDIEWANSECAFLNLEDGTIGVF